MKCINGHEVPESQICVTGTTLLCMKCAEEIARQWYLKKGAGMMEPLFAKHSKPEEEQTAKRVTFSSSAPCPHDGYSLILDVKRNVMRCPAGDYERPIEDEG